MRTVTTLGQFIIERQEDFPYAKGELSRLLRDIGIASKIVNREVNKAGLVDILGEHGTTNIQGETVKKLDVYANDQFIAALSAGGETCGIASEENDDLVPMTSKVSKNAKYVVCVDPLDGSSNIDVNVSIGTIFSIYRRTDLRQAAYGTRVSPAGPQRRSLPAMSSMVHPPCSVYTTGRGVNGFTLDPSIGEFCLSHPDMRCPETDASIPSMRATTPIFPRASRNTSSTVRSKIAPPVALFFTLHRLARGRLPPQSPQGRNFHLSLHRQITEGKTASPLRMQSPCVHHRAGRRQGVRWSAQNPRAQTNISAPAHAPFHRLCPTWSPKPKSS